jgi:Mrp family chromosome partitioning ATPase
MITRESGAPSVAQSRPPKLVRGKARDEFHSLLRSLPWPAASPADRQLSAIGFTSCLPGEGVTTFALQTALAAASAGVHKILLVDANLNRPALEAAVGLSKGQGLAEILSGQCNATDVIQETRYSNLSMLSAGKVDQDAATLYGLPYRLQNLVEVLTHGFDLVIFDMPAIGESSVSMPLLSPLDGVVMIVESERVQWQMARLVKNRLDRANVNLIGAVVNKKRDYVPALISRIV